MSPNGGNTAVPTSLTGDRVVPDADVHRVADLRVDVMQRLGPHEQLARTARGAPVDHRGRQLSLHEGDRERVDSVALEVDLDDGPGRGTLDVVVGAAARGRRAGRGWGAPGRPS